MTSDARAAAVWTLANDAAMQIASCSLVSTRQAIVADAIQQGMALAEQECLEQERSNSDRAFIEGTFREGMRAADAQAPDHCPYGEHSLAAHWWTRGFESVAAHLRASEAEARLAAMAQDRGTAQLTDEDA